MLIRTAITLFSISLAASTALGAPPSNSVIPLNGNDWRIAVDPQNVGVAERWFDAPRPDAKLTRVPALIQDVFPGYAGVAWYWRDVVVPANISKDSRYLLRFWEVDYLAGVWLNGHPIGRHEGAQACFTLDATEPMRPGATNRIAVRVVSPFQQPIDGFIRAQTPHGGFTSFSIGGILDSVELLVVPQVRLDDLFVRADPKTGVIRIEAGVCNTSTSAVKGAIEFAVARATSGEPLSTIIVLHEFKPGTDTLRTEMQLANPRLWELNDPCLYRLTARVTAADSAASHGSSIRFGFRDFRFENGYFRLNGKRVFWRSTHTGADVPGNIRLPSDPDLLRRDLLDLKAMGFNGVRFISTLGQRYQLDLCDEIGLMVYEESYASWQLQDSPKLGERMDRSFTGMILRDRNHPSVVMWGFLNETGLGSVFNHAVNSLPLARRLDDSRIVMLGSGRWDTVGNYLNGLELWKPDSGFAPCLAHNPKPYGLCAITLWRSNEISLIPGVRGEYGAVRWTAPTDGNYTISAKFRGTGHYTTTDIHVFQAGKTLFDGFINRKGRGDGCTMAKTVRAAKGEALDFVVGGQTPGGGAWYERWANNTTLSIAIQSADDKTYDLATDFSNTHNPSDAWTYGWLAAGPTPDVTTFKPFPKCEIEKHDVIGGLSNPGSDRWEDVLADTHYYPRVPHRELEIARLRTFAGNDHPQYLSEYGIGSAVDLPRFLRQCEQNGLESSDLANEVRARLEAFMGDWERWRLGDTFANPEDYFEQCVAKMAGLKRLGINAIRSNPNIVGYGMTGCNDPLAYGEGQMTAFRELKPGTVDAIFDGFYPVRWCTFVEPVSVYRGASVRVEAVLANEDAAKPGEYPARIEIVGPKNRRVFQRSITVKIPATEPVKEPPLASPVFSEDVVVDGPSGQYRFLVTFEKGVAASGGKTEFYVTDPADMPPVTAEVSLWGADPELASWLKDRGVHVRPYQPGQASTRQVILVSSAARTGGTAEAWRDLATRIAQGSTAVFLVPDVFRKGDQPLGWLPLAKKGALRMTSEFSFPQVYLKDEWSKKHPLFEGLPSGGLMDYTFYRELIPDYRFSGQDTPSEAVAGSFRTSAPGHLAELMLAVYDFGSGRFVLNSLRIRQELGHDPTAERLLRNLLRFAARDADRPVEPPKDGVDALLRTIGY